MTRYILLFAVTAVLTGCKGDVSETAPPPETENSQSTTSTSVQNSDGTSNTSSTTDQTPGQPSQTSAVHDSPAAVFAALQQASAADDLPAAIRCMDAETQKIMAAMISLPLALMTIDPEKQEGIKELMSKHGISLEEPSTEFPIETEQGRIAFIIDVQEWIEEHADTSESSEKGLLHQLANASLGEVTIEGNSAQGTLTTADGSSDEIEFKRVDGQWLIHMDEPEISASSGMEDFDSTGFNSSGFGSFEETEENPAPVKAVTMDDYHAAWRVTLDVKDQPAGEQLEKLAEELGLKLTVAPRFETALQKPVSFQVTDGSRLQAIEDICRQLELTPRYTPAGISLESGRRKHPVKFAGPFLITINEFETEPQTATGQLSLKVHSAGLPPALLTSLNEDLQNSIDLEDLTDQEQNHLQRQVSLGFSAIPSSPVAYHREVIIDLKNLLRHVETIPNVQGRINLTLPTHMETMEFDALQPGVKKAVGAVTLELTDVNGGSVIFKYSGTDHEAIRLYAFDEQGKQLDSFAGGSIGSGDSGQINQSYQNTPASLKARVVTQQEALEYGFQFEAIPVPNHDQMPVQLPELQFETEAPLSVNFDSIIGEPNFRKIKLDVTNQSNKDARVLFLNFRYLDKQGNELERKSKQHGPVRIPAGEEGEIEVMAFFMPEKTRTVEVTLKRVEFADASQWKTEE